MKIEIDERSGFCFGVVKAITTAEALLCDHPGKNSEEEDRVFCLGDIVHNRIEVDRLRQSGLQTVTHERLDQLAGKTVLIRAHGEPPSTYELAQRHHIHLVDATCPVVAKLQQTVRQAWEEMKTVNGQVVIFGKRGHAEVVGLTGQVNEETIVAEGFEDLAKIDYARPIYLLSQTTQPLKGFSEMAEEIRKRAQVKENIKIHDTICRQVSNRNPHLREFAATHSVVVFVSGRKSSNGKALFEVCLETNPRTYLVEEATEVRAAWFTGKRITSVGICGATSTPKWLMEEVAEAIRKI